jgi:hypothetical protein
MLERAAARTTRLMTGFCPEPAFATRQPTRFARPMLARSIMKQGRGENNAQDNRSAYRIDPTRHPGWSKEEQPFPVDLNYIITERFRRTRAKASPRVGQWRCKIVTLARILHLIRAVAFLHRFGPNGYRVSCWPNASSPTPFRARTLIKAPAGLAFARVCAGA